MSLIWRGNNQVVQWGLDLGYRNSYWSISHAQLKRCPSTQRRENQREKTRHQKLFPPVIIHLTPCSRLYKARPGNGGVRALWRSDGLPLRSPASGIPGRGERKPAARSNQRKRKQARKNLNLSLDSQTAHVSCFGRKGVISRRPWRLCRFSSRSPICHRNCHRTG